MLKLVTLFYSRVLICLSCCIVLRDSKSLSNYTNLPMLTSQGTIFYLLYCLAKEELGTVVMASSCSDLIKRLQETRQE